MFGTEELAVGKIDFHSTLNFMAYYSEILIFTTNLFESTTLIFEAF